MAQERAQAFMKALQEYEESGNLDPLVQLFADDCLVSNIASPHRFEGRDGARRFWTEYRGLLGNIRSIFRNAIESGDRVALEWESRGTAFTGAPIAYEGVSILEYEGERVKRFYAYYDPHRLGLELKEIEREQRPPA
ncbi:MAG: nuclear transport factor 2 family protein [Myxococcaceae bacterium]|nr:nuclear transport factor 2 family protein [Myxococcaceae bacterium]MCI0672803.1 nuclear transport factor 2 family protein [Myxococcaceae bacterium]